MKQILLTAVASIIVAFYTQAQQFQDSTNYKFEKGNVGVTFGLSGLQNYAYGASTLFQNPFVFVKYAAKKNVLLRMGLGININNSRSSSEYVNGSSTWVYTTEAKKSIYTMILGAEYHFKGTKRLDPYVGGQIDLGFIGPSKNYTDDKTILSTGDYTGNSRESKTPIGYGLGGRAIIGFNYFVAKKWSVGAEYSIGGNYTNQTGNGTNTNTSYSYQGGVYSSTTNTTNGNVKNTNQGVFTNNASLHTTFFF